MFSVFSCESDLYCDELHPKTVYFGLTRTHFGLTRTHFGLTRTHFGLTCKHFGLTRTHFGLTHRKVLLAVETQHKTKNIDDIYFQTCIID